MNNLKIEIYQLIDPNYSHLYNSKNNLYNGQLRDGWGSIVMLKDKQTFARNWNDDDWIHIDDIRPEDLKNEKIFERL